MICHRKLKSLYFILFYLLFDILMSKLLCNQLSDAKSSFLSAVNCPSNYNSIQILHQVTPYGNSSSGTFTKMKNVKDIFACTKLCCLSAHCDVVFFYNTTCYHITCKSQALCQPVKRSNKKFLSSSMVLIRIADNRAMTTTTTMPSDYYDLFNEKDFAYNYNDDHQMRREEPLTSPKMTSTNDYEDKIFEDPEQQQNLRQQNLRRQDFGIQHDTIPDDRVQQDIMGQRVQCMYTGYNQCDENEVCKPIKSMVQRRRRKEQGICQCKDGFERNQKGKCIKMDVQLSNDYSSESKESSKESTAIPVERLVVSAGGSHEIQLPNNKITLSAFVVPESGSPSSSSLSKYTYKWNLVWRSQSGDDEYGNMEGTTSQELKLSNLKAGNYTFKVEVKGDHAKGEALVNVTVHPPHRINQPPIAVIQPSNSTVQLPNKDTVLEGSFSKDDNNEIAKFKWELINFPIAYKDIPSSDPSLTSGQTLQLKNLIPGFYQVKLTVTDKDGASNSTIANVTVLKEIDYPPTANAGPDVVIHLPQNEVILMGNQSTDDKGISSWQWTRATEGGSADEGKSLTVDMDGTSTPFLHLSKLEFGVYKFILKITDTSNQTSSAEVHVFVKPENNSPPKSVISNGKNLKITLPLNGPIGLDGSSSHDDAGIAKWKWEQLKGPRKANLQGENEAKINVSGLIPGEYWFNLTVWDSKGANDSSQIIITVIQLKNSHPVAYAGGDKSIILPDDQQVFINGSGSYDDVEIQSYLWERSPESLAAGDIIDNSTYKPVLKLANIIPGRYVFKLTVTDGQGASSSDVTSLIVRPPNDLLDQIELTLNTDIKSFTSDQEANILRRLKLLLSENEQVNINKIKLDASSKSKRVILKFTVISNGKSISGKQIVKHLKRKIKSDSDLISPQVLSVETVVCQNECSGHGNCDQYTKNCLCEAFWMENFISVYLNDAESNCEWSVLYVTLISFTISVLTTGLIWFCICFCTRFKTKRFTKRRDRFKKLNNKIYNRYTLLEDDYCSGDATADQVELIANSNSLRRKKLNNNFSDDYDEDNTDDESDTLFETTTRKNMMNNRLSKEKHHQKSLNGLVNQRKVLA